MREVRAREKTVYTFGLVGQNMIYNFVAMYIMFFFTDILGIVPAAATAITVVATIWDAVNDPIMGSIADKTRTRWGKFRPYLVVGPFFIGLATVLCFTDFGLGAAAVAVAAACYILWDMAYTVCDVPIWAIASVSSHNSGEKDRLITLGKIGGTVGTAIVTVCGIMVINAFGGERMASAYTLAAMVFVLLGCIPMVLCGLVMRERIAPKAGKAEPVRRNIKTITKNKPLMLLFVSLLLVNMVNNLRQAGQMYFCVYVWGDSGLLTPVGIALILGMCIGMAVTPRLLARFEKRLVYMAACALGFVSCVIPFATGVGNVAYGLVMLGISFAFTGMTTIASMSMLMDGIDYSEWKLGFRGEGLVFSANTFLNKMSAAVSRGVLGIGLVLMGYVENQPVTDATTGGFTALMFLVPAVCFLLSMVPMLFYRITAEERAAINDMQQKRG